MKILLTAVMAACTILGVVHGQRCSSSLDCSSPDAPYCSSWGWCQWTSKHGVHGPSEIVQTEEEVRTRQTDKRSFATTKVKKSEVPEFKITDYTDNYGAEIYDYYGSYDIMKKVVDEKDGGLDSSIFGGNVKLVQVITPPPPVNHDFYPEDDDYYATEDDFYPTVDSQATIVSQNEDVSEGCLYDCVNDCVSIDKLTAYRDCVDFCGRSCDQ